MAFNVDTYTSEETLSDAIQAVVNTFPDEQSLEDYLETILAADIYSILAKGAHFTVIETPGIVNVSLGIVAKGAFFTVILETV